MIDRRETKSVWTRRLLATSSLVGAAALLVLSDPEPAAATAPCAVSVSGASGPVTNSSAINCIRVSGAVVTGDITNARPNGVITTPGTGIFVANSTINGAIVNNGTITAGASGILLLGPGAVVSNGVSNRGTISTGGISGVGIFLASVSTFSGGVSNSGTISEAASGDVGIGVSSVSTFSGGVSNSGTISAGGAGIDLDVRTFSGGISNSGTIGGGGLGIVVFFASTFSGGISNSGTISVGRLSDGIYLFVDTISGGISNSGTISAAGIGIHMASTNSVSVFDSGTIIGGSGTAIRFGGGTNTLTLGAGYSITGSVLGAGADVFQLGGTGSDTFNLSTIGAAAQYRGFATFAVVSGVWDVTGTFGQTQAWNVNGGTLAGTGTLSSVNVNAGGTLAPGPVGSVGALTVNGALTFNAGSTYAVTVTPTAASSTIVTGTASLTGGTVHTIFQPGVYVTRSYTILTSAGLGGTTFAGVSGNAVGFTEALSYTATDVVLNLTAALGGAGLGRNQQNIATSLNSYFNNGGALPPSFVNVFMLTDGALGNGLSQLSGETAGGAKQSGFQFGNSFLSTMLDPYTEGRGGGLGEAGGFGAALGYAGDETPPAIASAYSALAKPAPIAQPHWNFWGAAFGGAAGLGGNGATGSHNTSAGAAGFAAGADYHIAPDTMIGFALAGGGTNWSLSDSLGKGSSAAFQAGLYGAHEFGPAYISGALAFGDFSVTTNRTVTLPGGDTYNASFDAQSYSARLESGYHIALSPVTLTPYAALQVQNFQAPAYGERAANGAASFALHYNAQSATDTRFELGAWADKTFALPDGNAMKLFGRAAWAHDWQSSSSLQATFLSLPAVSFAVTGARQAPDQALLTAGVEWRFAKDWTAMAKLDGEVGGGSHTYAATARVSYAW